MKILGFDLLLLDELQCRDNFMYEGYSATGCVLSSLLKCYQIVDNPDETPYQECKNTLWGGLGIIDFAFMPHVDFERESADINKEVLLCKEQNIPYKTVRDGEVLIL